MRLFKFVWKYFTLYMFSYGVSREHSEFNISFQVDNKFFQRHGYEKLCTSVILKLFRNIKGNWFLAQRKKVITFAHKFLLTYLSDCTKVVSANTRFSGGCNFYILFYKRYYLISIRSIYKTHLPIL